MRFDVRLTGEADGLARAHERLLDRLPATVQASLLVELQKWPRLFPAEQRYQRALLDTLAERPAPQLAGEVAAIVRVEAEAGADRLKERDPSRFQDEAQALLRKRRLLTAWRQQIDVFFRTVDPAIDARLHPPDGPRRLVVQIYGTGIAIQMQKLWSRFTGTGTRVRLDVPEALGARGFLQALFGPGEQEGGLFAAAARAGDATPLEAWVLEAQELLHGLCETSRGAGTASAITGLSYERLRAYRDALTRALYAKIQSGVESPQAFAAYARGLTLSPEPGVLPHADEAVRGFVRDVLLTGNGTLFVNNTFVEWAAVQALRRAQPRVMVARYGIRDRMKPFSSLLLFSQPRASDQIPLIEDPVGSFVDVEQLSYYVWLHAEKSAAYRGRTLYLFLAEGVGEMLAIAPATAPGIVSQVARLDDVHATMARWLGLPAGSTTGAPIAGLVD